MNHIYTADQLTEKSLAELKQIAVSIGVDKPADSRKKANWVEAILEGQPQKIESELSDELGVPLVYLMNGEFYTDGNSLLGKEAKEEYLVSRTAAKYYVSRNEIRGLDLRIVEQPAKVLPNSKVVVTEWDTSTVAPVERKYEVSPQAKLWLKEKLVYQGNALGWFIADLEGQILTTRYRRLIDAVAARYELVNEAKAKKQPTPTQKIERTPREIKHLGEGLFKVVGDTGNTYLVEYLNGETQCQCEASKHGRDCYHARAVRASAESFPNLRNQRLFAELSQAALGNDCYLLTPDWLSFSAGIARDGVKLGEIGCNGANQWWVRWYAYGNSRKAESAADAMRVLMMAKGVAMAV